MSEIFYLDQIKEVVAELDVTGLIEEGFVAYSQEKVVVPPVGEMVFKNPPGDTHIKYGYIKDDDYFVIKIASGFYENYKFDLPSSSGVMLLFSQKTGRLECVLADEGYLTDIRTAIAGQIAAKYLGPKEVKAIGVFGTGIQGKLQVEYLQPVTDCKQVVVWGRTEEKLKEYKQNLESKGYSVETTTDSTAVTEQCNLIITATPSTTPLFQAEQLLPGTHITAMGSDTSEKQELACDILAKADRVVADSIEQCLVRGEIHKALTAGVLKKEVIVELGTVITSPELGRTSDQQLTVVDLTGVAVQDIQIAKAAYSALKG